MSRRRDLALVSLGSAVSWFGNALALISLMLVLRPAGGSAPTAARNATPTGPARAGRS